MGNDRGAVLPLVAVSLVALFALAAYSVDVGYVYATKSRLQGTADASALAAVTELPSIADMQATGVQYGGLNYPGGGAVVVSSDVVPGIWDLASESFSAWVAPYNAVRVVAKRAQSNDNPLGLFFAPVIGNDTADVGATAVAMAGAPRSLTTLPLIFSDCEWEKYGEGQPLPTGEVVIYFHGKEESCHTSPSGQDLPGGFGWLTPTGPCEATIEIGDWVSVSTGTPPPLSCTPPYLKSLVGNVVAIPFFDDIIGTGATAKYHVVDFAALEVTGYNFGGQYKEPKGDLPCNGEDRCIRGHFVEKNFPGGGIGGPGGRGVTVVDLVD